MFSLLSALITCCTVLAQYKDLMLNGGFEDKMTANCPKDYCPSSTIPAAAIFPWIKSSIPANAYLDTFTAVRKTLWQPDTGDWLLHLARDISQNFQLVVGVTYQVQFQLSHNTECDALPKTGFIVATGAPSMNFAHDVTQPKWVQTTYEFTATNASTTITISGSNAGYCAILVDTISLFQKVEFCGWSPTNPCYCYVASPPTSSVWSCDNCPSRFAYCALHSTSGNDSTFPQTISATAPFSVNPPIPASSLNDELMWNNGFEMYASQYCLNPGWCGLGGDPIPAAGITPWYVPANTSSYNLVRWYPAYSGTWSVELRNDNLNSMISQNISTDVGFIYEVTFQLTHNTYCDQLPKTGFVVAGALVKKYFTHAVTDPKWVQVRYRFTAVATTTPISFGGISTGPCGTAIDAISAKLL